MSGRAVSVLGPGWMGAVNANRYLVGTVSLRTWKAWADQFVRAEQDACIDPRVAQAVRGHLALAVARGHGADDIFAFFAAFGPDQAD